MIRFENVTYRYPFQEKPAVRDISLRIAPGELVLCTGASGCGKSTLMRLANGLCPHHFQGNMEGHVLVDGIPTFERPVREIAQAVGTLFQDPEQQFFALNVEDELAFVHEWRGVPPERIRKMIGEAAGQFGITPLLGSSILEISEGQKQKVGLASLLSQEPKALILDEPTANLDPEATTELALWLAELRKRGMAILVVDHRLYWLKNIADRVVVMRDGRICEQGDFHLLEKASLCESYGLRAAHVRDVRQTLPDCREVSGDDNGKGLRVHDLTFAHPRSCPLFHHDFIALKPGITALVGNNGAGKTTLARLLAGLNEAKTGTFFFDGRAMHPSDLLTRVGIVLQNADHQLHMKTVRQEIEVCLALAGRTSGSSSGRPAGKQQEETDSLLELFALKELEDRHPQSLSGGEKQRLVIACAFAKNPDVLILDEPTSGLDGRNMERIAESLRVLAERGACVLVVTHDLELMERSCTSALRLPLDRTTVTFKENCHGTESRYDT